MPAPGDGSPSVRCVGSGLYAAFDRFPSPKGAATHLGAWAPTLAERVDPLVLAVLGDASMPGWQREGRIEIVRDRRTGADPLTRAIAFGRAVTALADRRDDLVLAQARDPWGAAGLGASRAVRRGDVPLVFEVNGLPSIELPVAWPGLTPATLAKITALEDRCLRSADAVVVPSGVLAALLRARGVPDERLHVIPNGATVASSPPPRPADAPERYVVYVGAVQPWQGVDVALAAMRRLADLDVALVVCAAAPPKRTRSLRALSRRLGVEDRVVWHHGVDRTEVAAWLAGAAASLAPLRSGARNVTQGCCPLKVLESLAAGTPVVASDLPAVREIMRDDEHGRLVPPDRPDALARALRVLLDHPELGARWGEAGRRHIADHLSWRHSCERLAAVHDGLGSGDVRA